MPDLKIYYPAMLFMDEIGTDEDAMQEFCVAAAEIVARNMDCDDYDGNPVELTQDHVDVHLIPYTYERVRFTGASVLVEITGYDYPSRMDTIGGRMFKVRGALEALVKRHKKGLDGKVVSATFIPIKDGCWA